MSRIGKAPVLVPDGVQVIIQDNTITATGPLGTNTIKLRPEIIIRQEGNIIYVERANDERRTLALHGLSRTLVFNLVNGVNTGFTKNLEIHGVGYRAGKEDNVLVLSLGYSHPVKLDIPVGIEVKLEGNTKLAITSSDKQKVGDFAALVRRKRPPEVYKGKGIRYQGEVIRKKAGKTGKK